MTEDFYNLIMETPEAERVGEVFKLNALRTGLPITSKRVIKIVGNIGRKAGVVVAAPEKRGRGNETGKLLRSRLLMNRSAVKTLAKIGPYDRILWWIFDH